MIKNIRNLSLTYACKWVLFSKKVSRRFIICHAMFLYGNTVSLRYNILSFPPWILLYSMPCFCIATLFAWIIITWVLFHEYYHMSCHISVWQHCFTWKYYLSFPPWIAFYSIMCYCMATLFTWIIISWVFFHEYHCTPCHVSVWQHWSYVE